MKGQRRIETITAFIALDPSDNTEGIIGMTGPNGHSVPLIAADHEMLLRLRPIAEITAREMNLEVRVVRFSNREELDVIHPREAQA